MLNGGRKLNAHAHELDDSGPWADQGRMREYSHLIHHGSELNVAEAVLGMITVPCRIVRRHIPAEPLVEKGRVRIDDGQCHAGRPTATGRSILIILRRGRDYVEP